MDSKHVKTIFSMYMQGVLGGQLPIFAGTITSWVS